MTGEKELTDMDRQVLFRYLNAIIMKLDNLLMLFDKGKKKSFVAMFHDVVSDSNRLGEDQFAITLKNLSSFLETCNSFGYEIVSIDEWIEMSCKESLYGKVVITFDDGYDSIYNAVDPLFKEKCIPYTVFLTTSYLDKSGYLSRHQLKEVSENSLCTIAMHADQHLLYRYETDDCLRQNYTRCRQVIADITGKKPVHFAFPYGSTYACSKHNCRVVKKMGASSVFLTRQKKLGYHDKLWLNGIPRLNIPGYYNNTMKKSIEESIYE